MCSELHVYFSPFLSPSLYASAGCTPRDLAMDSDFYDCADLIDDLEKLQIKQMEDAIRSKRLEGWYGSSFKVSNVLLVLIARQGLTRWCMEHALISLYVL